MKAPEPKHPYRHKMPIQIRFNDVDILGHVNNCMYLQYLDLGKAAYFNQFLPSGRLDPHALGLVIANININFFLPSFMHEHLEVHTAVESIAHKSILLDQRIVSVDTGEVKCTATVTMVGFNAETMTSEEITPEWRRKLSDFERREL